METEELIYENKGYRCKIYVKKGLSKKKKEALKRKWKRYYSVNTNFGVDKEEIVEANGYLFD